MEFFAEKDDVGLILNKIDERGDDWVNYFAANASVSANLSFVHWSQIPLTI